MSTDHQPSLNLSDETSAVAPVADLDLKDLLKRYRDLHKGLSALSEIDPRRPDIVNQVEMAIRRLPDTPSIVKELDSIRTLLSEYLALEKKRNLESFGRVEAMFINAAREKQMVLRESGDGWRIGRLLLVVKKDSATVQVKFNDQELVPSVRVSSSDDIFNAIKQGNELLDQHTVSPVKLEALFARAYQYAVTMRKSSGAAKTEPVPLDEFYRELRTARLAIEIGTAPERRVKSTDMPRWEYLYLLDTYRAASSSISQNGRLTFDTGSQSESHSSKAMKLGGLNPNQEYKVFCYIKRAAE